MIALKPEGVALVIGWEAERHRFAALPVGPESNLHVLHQDMGGFNRLMKECDAIVERIRQCNAKAVKGG